MTTAHTATPWAVNKSRTAGAVTHWHITGAKHGSVYPICAHTIEDEPSGTEQLENAEFIVCACNAHNDLVKALEEAQHFLRFHHTSEDAHMVRIAAALAKAGA